VYYVYASAKVSCLTLGRLDELLLPYYRNDLANGIMTDEEAACLIDDFYAKTNLTLGRGEHQMSNSPNNPNNTGWERNPLYDSPTYILLGGKSSKRDTSEENPLTELFLRRIQPGFKHPVVIFRWSEECPDSHWHLLCEKLSAGSSILVYNDETMIPAMIHAGVEPDDAFGYSIHPCNWPDIDGGFCAVAPLGEPIPKMIMRVLMGEERKNFETIDGIYSALAEDFRERAKAVFSDYRLRFRNDKTQPVWCAISGTDCFTRGVIESARNHMDGGVKYPAIYTVLRNIGTAADMMTALDKIVFCEKLRSLAEMRAALDTNFAEDPELLAYCRKAPKYGTDSEEADSHAVRLMKTLLDVIDEESVNEIGVRDVISMNITTTDMWHIGEGASLGATPDGRLAGEPLSENLSPTVGVNEGVTALFNSVSKLPFKRKFINDSDGIWENFHFTRTYYYLFLRDLERRGVNFDAIGLQYHQFIPREERIITIEDNAELQIQGVENLVRLEARKENTQGEHAITIRDLIKASLRLRPDRVIVGEVRGEEAIDMIQAMNTGHDGSMSTGHGNSIKGMLNRLETMYLTDSQVSVDSVRNQIANAIDIFIHLRRDAKGRRYVEEVAEMTDYDGKDYKLNYLYKAGEDGKLASTGNGLCDRERLIRCGYESMMTGKRSA
jgi:hypothetical protein